MHDNRKLSDILKGILSTRSPRRIDSEHRLYRHASVLIPLLEVDGDIQVLFTKRTNKVEHHKGEISFPGGSVDEEDVSIEQTVLREVYEEIGLPSRDVDILGRIDDAHTLVSNFVVHPFVGLVPFPFDFVLNEHEVERLIRVPLNIFDPKSTAAKELAIEFEGVSYHSKAYDYKGDLIWGATARIMDNFVGIIGGKLPLLGQGQSAIL